MRTEVPFTERECFYRTGLVQGGSLHEDGECIFEDLIGRKNNMIDNMRPPK